MRHHKPWTRLPVWLPPVLSGRDPGDDDNNDGGDGGSGDGGAGDGTGDNEGGSGDGSNDGAGDGGGEGGEDDKARLEKALEAERKQRRQLEKENIRFKKAQKESEDQEAKDLREANEKIEKSRTTVERLATTLRTQAVHTAIERAARDANFFDVDDAIHGVDMEEIDVEQDDDDPTQVSVDKDSVKRAVTKLANAKKHLIKPPGNGVKSGSNMGGSPGNNDGKASEEDLKKRYPSLAN